MRRPLPIPEPRGHRRLLSLLSLLHLLVRVLRQRPGRPWLVRPSSRRRLHPHRNRGWSRRRFPQLPSPAVNRSLRAQGIFPAAMNCLRHGAMISSPLFPKGPVPGSLRHGLWTLGMGRRSLPYRMSRTAAGVLSSLERSSRPSPPGLVSPCRLFLSWMRPVHRRRRHRRRRGPCRVVPPMSSTRLWISMSWLMQMHPRGLRWSGWPRRFRVPPLWIRHEPSRRHPAPEPGRSLIPCTPMPFRR